MKKETPPPARIQREDFSVEEELEWLRAAGKHIGGIVTFIGTARDVSQGRQVSRLAFEEYAGMATKALQALRRQALERFDVIEVRLVHRIGTIEAGGQIVLIAVAARHRAAAFDACRWCIDTLKKTVPIWKKEITPTGESWVEAHP